MWVFAPPLSNVSLNLRKIRVANAFSSNPLKGNYMLFTLQFKSIVCLVPGTIGWWSLLMVWPQASGRDLTWAQCDPFSNLLSLALHDFLDSHRETYGTWLALKEHRKDWVQVCPMLPSPSLKFWLSYPTQPSIFLYSGEPQKCRNINWAAGGGWVMHKALRLYTQKRREMTNSLVPLSSRVNRSPDEPGPCEEAL